jgi:hypothetical protein
MSLERPAVESRSDPTDEPGATLAMLDLMQDLWAYMKERKKFWLAPIILLLVLLGALIVLTQGSAIAPFIYTLF